MLLAACFVSLKLNRWGFSVRNIASLPLLIILAGVVVYDLKDRRIPNLLVVPGLAYALVLASIDGQPGIVSAATGASVAGGVVLVLALVSRGGIGGGDVKLSAMLGAALGWQEALAALALSQVVGLAIVLLISLARRRLLRSHFPVGALIAGFGALLLIARP